MIGAGNVAVNLAQALAKHVDVLQVYSRKLSNANFLAAKVDAEATDDLSRISEDADIYIISVKDDAISSVIDAVPDNGALWVHTSGSKPMELFAGKRRRYGVLYPMQSFSKQITVDFHDVPFFIEAAKESDVESIENLASQLSTKVFRADSELRRRLHVAAVFSCNFANHMWVLAHDVLQEAGLPFDVMLPLIRTTVDKLDKLSPAESQTGPAIRKDYNVMDAHMKMLHDEDVRRLYSILSESIIRYSEKTINDVKMS